MTDETFMKLPDGQMFATGVISDDLEGINMTGSGKGLRWVAKKGYAPQGDWAVYCHWEAQSIEYVLESGDKVVTERNIRRCVSCDDKMYSKYRI